MMMKTLTIAISCCALLMHAVQAAVPSMPRVKLTAHSDKPPFASANTAPGVNALDLQQFGYVEEEYYLSGKAAVRDETGAVVLTDQPYTTRFLIRKPKVGKHFSGNVVVTIGNWDHESYREWGFLKKYIVNYGDAFIGISIVKYQIPGFPVPNGLKMLQDWDPLRYRELSVYDDKSEKRLDLPQGQDILAQLGLLLKSNHADGPMKGLKVKRVIGYTDGIASIVYRNYVAQGRHIDQRMPNGKPLFDAYMVGAFVLLPAPEPAQIGDAIYVMNQHEREFHRDNVAKLSIPADSDVNKFRLYDLVGTPHIGTVTLNEQTGEYIRGNFIPEIPEPPAKPRDNPLCKIAIDERGDLLYPALLHGIERWLSGGPPLPRAPRVERALDGSGEKIDPLTGNAIGGVRPPWIQVPAATYYSGIALGCGTWDSIVKYDSAKLISLYGTYAVYAQEYEAAKARFVDEGFLLPENAAQMKPTAKLADFVGP